MIKCFCDKCGTELNDKGFWTLRYSNGFQTYTKFIYLCNECESVFKNFIENDLKNCQTVIEKHKYESEA
jgi:hypothetical protein